MEEILFHIFPNQSVKSVKREEANNYKECVYNVMCIMSNQWKHQMKKMKPVYL